MHIKSLSDLKTELKQFDYSLDDDAEFLGTGSEQVVIKSNGKVIHFIGMGYSKLKPSEIKIAVNEMKSYFSKLSKVKLNISKPDFKNILIFKKPFPLIIIEDKFEGIPVEDEMFKSDKNYLNLFSKLLKETLKAVNNKVPMDSSAKNYVLNSKGKVVYVDFFVPYTAKWLFHKNSSKEFVIFTLLNFFVPNCELFIFVSKAIIKKPHLKKQILKIVYSKTKGALKKKLKDKFESEEYDFLLKNHKKLMDDYREEMSDSEIFKKIGYFDRTKKLILNKSEVTASSFLIKELYKKMGKQFMARPYNCLLWAKQDIEDAVKIMGRLR